MSAIEPASSQPDPAQELDALRAKSLSLGQEMSRLLPLSDSNSTYRNDIIWLAEEINRLEKKIKDLESKIRSAAG